MAPWKTKIRPLAREYALSVAFWLPLSVLVGWQTHVVNMQLQLPANLPRLLLVYGARYLTLAILTPPIFHCVKRWPVTSGAAIRRTAGYALGYAPFLVAFGVIRWLLLPTWLDGMGAWEPRTLSSLQDLMFDKFADLLLLYLTIVIAAHAYTYFVRGQRQEIERLQLRQSLAQSELETLRAQLHPHFLFNTLQGVSTLIDTDRGAAQRMLRTLAELLRTVLKHGSTDVVTFREELDFVRAYLNLEQMRLATRLDVQWRIAPEADAALIPQLLMQPLIENAVLHGIANSSERGWISVEARVRDGQLVVRITNSVAGPARPGLGLGLVSVRARLKFMYSDDARFEFGLQANPPRAVALLELPAFTTAVAGKCASVRALDEQQCES
jgi:two-component system LytT family sensor kinase